MRLIFHIGTAKTGTSTLQASLDANSRLLARSGILYPKAKSRAPNHNDLTRLLHPMEDMPREFTSRDDDFASIRAQGVAFWDDLKKQARRSNADVVVLSGEYVYGLDESKLEALRTLLREIADDIQIVCYVREPASYYVSLTQQIIKASHQIYPPGRFKTRARECLPRFVSIFDGKVSVRSYDRAALLDEDIVRDFAVAYLPDGEALARTMTVANSNESMSAEAMCILQELRRREWPDCNDQFFAESDTVREALVSMRDRSDQTAPTLTPELRAAVVRRNLPDLRYLEEEFGVVLDRAGVEDTGRGNLPAGWLSQDLREILDVDPERIERTVYALLRQLSARDVASTRS